MLSHEHLLYCTRYIFTDERKNVLSLALYRIPGVHDLMGAKEGNTNQQETDDAPAPS